MNLTLPTGTMHATAAGTLPVGAAKGAFAELEKQVKKHQQKLRKDYVWKRKRALPRCWNRATLRHPTSGRLR